MDGELLVCHLGTLEYGRALELQHELRARRQADEVGDVLLLVEHPPVYTVGRRADASGLPMGEAWYRSQGIDIVDVDRGGQVTYHGPGQLVGYPIMRVTDVVAHVRRMEAALVDALGQEGVVARQRTAEGAAFAGVWVQDRKIASVGVHLNRSVTTHGFAVNVDNDLQPFGWIVACGLEGVRMTSLEAETGQTGRMACLRKRVQHAFAQQCGLRMRLVTPQRLGLATPVAA